MSMGQLRQLSGVLLDMCGQHEHQQLLGKEKPAQLLDAFAGKKLAELKDNLKKSYREYRQLQKELSENALDEQTRKREMDLLSFEVNEIEEAALIPEEEEELEKSYRKMSSARQLQETAGLVYGITGYEEDGSAGELIGDVAVNMPFLPRFFQCLISFYRTFLAGSANGKLHSHNRQSKYHQKDQVTQYKRTAAAFSCNIRKFPDITDSDGTSGRYQDKSHTRL